MYTINFIHSGMWGWCCPSCVLIDISARLGECAFVTSCVPGSLVTIRTRVRTLGGIRVCMIRYLYKEFIEMKTRKNKKYPKPD
jgi:hypothetical protein